MQNSLELKSGCSKTLTFKYNFSYILIKKILFTIESGTPLTVSDIIQYNPALLIKLKTRKGITLHQNYYLPAYFDSNSINPIIDFNNDSIVVPEFNFQSKLSAADFVIESILEFKSNKEGLKAFLAIDETPGVARQDEN